MAEGVILKAMQKDPLRRFQSMTEFRRDLSNAYGSISYRRIASATVSGFRSPVRASPWRTPTATCAASTSKCRRNADRTSENP